MRKKYPSLLFYKRVSGIQFSSSLITLLFSDERKNRTALRQNAELAYFLRPEGPDRIGSTNYRFLGNTHIEQMADKANG